METKVFKTLKFPISLLSFKNMLEIRNNFIVKFMENLINFLCSHKNKTKIKTMKRILGKPNLE